MLHILKKSPLKFKEIKMSVLRHANAALPRLKKIALFCMVSSLLSACSIFESEGVKTIIEGERISILQLEKQLVPEDIAGREDMYLPPAWQNEFWQDTTPNNNQ